MLFGPQGPLLPALRSLKIHGHLLLSPHPWIQQLTALSLRDAGWTGPEVISNLSGAPLKSLSLSLTHVDPVIKKINWNGLNFPYLTVLELFDASSDVFTALVTAKMPILRKASLSFEGTSAGALRDLCVALPTLQVLDLRGYPAGPAQGEVLTALASAVLPHIESFKWSTTASAAAGIVDKFLPGPLLDGPPAWARLCNLDIRLEAAWASSAHQGEFLSDLARVSAHFPNLTSLNVEYSSCRVPIQAVKTFVAVAEAAHAWPELRSLQINPRRYGANYEIECLHTVWPNVSLGP